MFTLISNYKNGENNFDYHRLNTWYSFYYFYFKIIIIIVVCFDIKNVNSLNPQAPTIATEIEFNIGDNFENNDQVTTISPEYETTTLSNDDLAISSIIDQIEIKNNPKIDTRFDLKDDFIIDPYMPKCDPKSETLSDCSNSCPATCEELNRKPCKNFCWRGCDCREGFVRNYQWKCIPVEECPKCKINEHYKNCGPECEQTCDTYENSPTYCDQSFCKRGCFCNYGFVRDMSNNGTCTPINKCPNKCGSNEYWDVNGEPCIRTVDNPRPKCLFEKPIPSCVCNTGFKRDPNTKQCIPITTERIRCGQNETYLLCGSDCAMNCFDENKREKCPTICNRGCFCNPGYRRQYITRTCVLPEDCNNQITNFNTNNNNEDFMAIQIP